MATMTVGPLKRDCLQGLLAALIGDSRSSKDRKKTAKGDDDDEGVRRAAPMTVQVDARIGTPVLETPLVKGRIPQECRMSGNVFETPVSEWLESRPSTGVVFSYYDASFKLMSVSLQCPVDGEPRRFFIDASALGEALGYSAEESVVLRISHSHCTVLLGAEEGGDVSSDRLALIEGEPDECHLRALDQEDVMPPPIETICFGPSGNFAQRTRRLTAGPGVKVATLRTFRDSKGAMVVADVAIDAGAIQREECWGTEAPPQRDLIDLRDGVVAAAAAADEDDAEQKMCTSFSDLVQDGDLTEERPAKRQRRDLISAYDESQLRRAMMGEPTVNKDLDLLTVHRSLAPCVDYLAEVWAMVYANNFAFVCPLRDNAGVLIVMLGCQVDEDD